MPIRPPSLFERICYFFIYAEIKVIRIKNKLSAYGLISG